jgi:long-subunit acyl-CoA synthetase (AMP-forming)
VISTSEGVGGNPAGSASTFVEGWLRTGDLGEVDSQEILTVTGGSRN